MIKKMSQIIILFIKIYQYALSPFLGARCRFTPTCSQYAVEALKKHGSIYGSWLSFRRVLRCHPHQPGGYDPVP
jgi:putative membrane protein insertion efficiency factor